MTRPRPVRAWSGPPLALQMLALLVGALIVAQLVTLVLTLVLPPEPPARYGLDDIAAGLGGGALPDHGGRPLERTTQAGPPDISGHGWLVSEQSRAELARMLHADPAGVRLAFYTELPFAGVTAPFVPGPPPGLLPPDARPTAAVEPIVRLRASDSFDGWSADSPAVLIRRAALGEPQSASAGSGGGFPGAGERSRGRVPGRGFPGGSGGFPGGAPRGGGVPGGFPRGDSSPSPSVPQSRQPFPDRFPTQAGTRGQQPQDSGRTPAESGTGGQTGQRPAPYGPPDRGGSSPGEGGRGFPGRGPAVDALPPPLVGPVNPAADPVQQQDSPTRLRDPAPPAPRVRVPLPQPEAAPAPAQPAPGPAIANDPSASEPATPAPRIPLAAPAPMMTESAAVPLPERPRGLFGLAPAPFIEGDFVAAVRRADGRWVLLAPRAEGFPNAWQRRVLLWFLLSLAIVAPLAWLFARRIVRPIQGFAHAAEVLGRDPSAAVLPLSGPAEIGRAAHAFNLMQNRLRSFVDDRTAMVGAISHDLRTPLTRLRFRIEDVPEDQQDGLLEEVAEMEAMITSVIEFIHDASAPNVRERLDLSELVGTVVRDAVMIGGDVTVDSTESAPVDVDVVGIRRVLDNLLENAVKYGDRARVRLRVDAGEAVAEILDDGPGIPDDEIERAFEPFYRSESARRSDKAGSGLGLAVCRSIARAHGGDVRLRRGPEGFVARVNVPLAFDARLPEAA